MFEKCQDLQTSLFFHHTKKKGATLAFLLSLSTVDTLPFSGHPDVGLR